MSQIRSNFTGEIVDYVVEEKAENWGLKAI
jgi:hypothetical protein